MNLGDRLFINGVDSNARENILGLNYKLKTLYAEIEMKLQKVTENHLVYLKQEVQLALNAIAHVVTLLSDNFEEAQQ